MNKIMAIGCAGLLLLLTACSKQSAIGQPASAAPSPAAKATANVNIKPHLTKEMALDIAQKTDSSKDAAWQEPYMDYNAEVDPDKNTVRTVWRVEADYPAGNKLIVTVDANNGKVWNVADIEPPGSGELGTAFTGLHDLHMADDKLGWVLGKKDVLRTEDGGQRWAIRTPAGYAADNTHAAFLDGKTAVVAAAQPGKLVIYRTSDGGQNWKSSTIKEGVYPDAAPFVTSVKFLDRNHGWILIELDAALGSEAVAAYRTTDGGSSWDLIAEGKPDAGKAGSIPFGGRKTGLSFADSRNGFLTGSDASDNIYVYATKDGGSVWKKVAVPVPQGLSADGGASSSYPPVFFTAKEGLLPVQFGGNTRALVFYATQDGGVTWTPTGKLQSEGDEYFDWSVVDPKYIVASDGTKLYVTKDGAKTWETIKPQGFTASDRLFIDFPNDEAGFAASQTILKKTNDVGLSWSQIQVGLIKH